MTQRPSGSGSPLVRTVTRGSSRSDTPMCVSYTVWHVRATTCGSHNDGLNTEPRSTRRSRTLLADRHDLHRRVANLLEKPIQRRSLPQDLETRARALSKDDVRNPLTLGERDQAVRGAVGFHAHNRGAKAFCEGDVALQRVTIGGRDPARRFTRRLDVDGIPSRPETAGNARTGAKD